MTAAIILWITLGVLTATAVAFTGFWAVIQVTISPITSYIDQTNQRIVEAKEEVIDRISNEITILKLELQLESTRTRSTIRDTAKIYDAPNYPVIMLSNTVGIQVQDFNSPDLFSMLGAEKMADYNVWASSPFVVSALKSATADQPMLFRAVPNHVYALARRNDINEAEISSAIEKLIVQINQAAFPQILGFVEGCFDIVPSKSDNAVLVTPKLPVSVVGKNGLICLESANMLLKFGWDKRFK